MLKPRYRANFGGGGQASLSSPCGIIPKKHFFVFYKQNKQKSYLSTIDGTEWQAYSENIFAVRDIFSKAAFTLAEVLITIGIIGVVASMTVPGIINDTRYAEIQASLKKNYSVISQAFKKMSEEKGYTITASYGNLILAEDMKKYFRIGFDCKGYNYNQYCYHPTKKSYKTFSGTEQAANSIIDDGGYMMTDGSLYLFENAGGGNRHTTYITVDTNSIKKGPNRWGYDLFTFQLTNDGKFLPMGAPDTHYTDMDTYCSKNSSSTLNGIACTERALNDPNYFKNLDK